MHSVTWVYTCILHFHKLIPLPGYVMICFHTTMHATAHNVIIVAVCILCLHCPLRQTADYLLTTMATSHTRPVFPEPEPRWGACGTAILNRLFVYRGLLQSFRGLCTIPQISLVKIFDVNTTKWTEMATTGTNPPALWSSACTSIGSKLYSYGGMTGPSRSNALHELETTTMHWKQLQPLNPSEGPMMKSLCGMIATSSSTLCAVGGFGLPTGSLQAGSRFIKSPRQTDGSGYTNEVHSYSLTTGTCLSPCFRIRHTGIALTIGASGHNTQCLYP